MKAIITYEDGTELEVDDFAPWACEVLEDPNATTEDIEALADYVIDVADGVQAVVIEDKEQHYRDGWDSVSTEREKTWGV